MQTVWRSSSPRCARGRSQSGERLAADEGLRISAYTGEPSPRLRMPLGGPARCRTARCGAPELDTRRPAFGPTLAALDLHLTA
jgi:hypothetical protein